MLRSHLILITLITLLLSFEKAYGQSDPLILQSVQNETVVFSGDLADGQLMQDLSWAWQSNNACFVEPSAEHFKGNHQLYLTELPAYSTLVITLIPDDPRQPLSLYAYSGGGGALPPALSSCVSCEADFPIERRVVGRSRPAHVRSVELRAVRNPYPVTIGVSGPAGSFSGTYRLEISLKKNR